MNCSSSRDACRTALAPFCSAVFGLLRLEEQVRTGGRALPTDRSRSLSPVPCMRYAEPGRLVGSACMHRLEELSSAASGLGGSREKGEGSVDSAREPWFLGPAACAYTPPPLQAMLNLSPVRNEARVGFGVAWRFQKASLSPNSCGRFAARRRPHSSV